MIARTQASTTVQPLDYKSSLPSSWELGLAVQVLDGDPT